MKVESELIDILVHDIRVPRYHWGTRLGNQERASPFGLFLLVKDGREDLMFRFTSEFETTMPNIERPSLSF
jgi:hypothetical protein